MSFNRQSYVGFAGGFGEVTFGKRLYNARSETVAEKPSFRDAWRHGQHCIVPVERIYEPDWRGGSAVPTRIQRKDGLPMGIAGLWASNRKATGEELLTFTMLTVNADDHELFKHFHKPGDEKRMVVILDAKDYDEWLACDVDEARVFFRQWMGPLDTFEAPLAPRAPPKKAAKKDAPPPVDKIPDDDGEPQLF